MYSKNFSASGLYYEKNFNLLYITKSYAPTSRSSVLKITKDKDQPFSNVFIWDINKQEKKALFSDELAAEQQVQRLTFEIAYNELEQDIVFSNEQYLFNNTDIAFRHPKNLLLIETYQPASQKSQLWLSTKQGDNLKMVAEFDTASIWHLDVKNNCIRIIQHLQKDVNIVEVKW